MFSILVMKVKVMKVPSQATAHIPYSFIVELPPGREGSTTFLILEYHPWDKNSDSLKKQRNWSLGFIHWEIVSNAENKSHCHFISLINWEKGKAYGLCQDQNSINSPLSEKSKLVLGKTVSSAGESWLMIKTRDFRLAAGGCESVDDVGRFSVSSRPSSHRLILVTLRKYLFLIVFLGLKLPVYSNASESVGRGSFLLNQEPEKKERIHLFA